MKALIPAAGLGARMLPVTKVVPKELLPIEGKPAIQWVLEEALSAGLREFVVVLSPRKAILRDFLTPIGEEHSFSGHRGLQELERLLRSVKIAFVEQPAPLGLGDALLRCRDVVGEEPFALLLPDNVFSDQSRLLKELVEVNRIQGKSCVALWKADGLNLGDGAVVAELRSDNIYNDRRVLSHWRWHARKAISLRAIIGYSQRHYNAIITEDHGFEISGLHSCRFCRANIMASASSHQQG